MTQAASTRADVVPWLVLPRLVVPWLCLCAALVSSCAPSVPAPSSAVLPALTMAGAREVLTLDGFVANRVIAVPDEGGVTLFVGRIIGGEQSFITAHAGDGVHFGAAHELIFDTTASFIGDVVRDDGAWRALYVDGTAHDVLSTSSDGVHFGDAVPLSFADRPRDALGRLVRVDDHVHLYFDDDRSGACADVGCDRSAISASRSSSSTLDGRFAKPSDVLADPPRDTDCAGCGVDVWRLVDVVRPGADRCSFVAPVLAVLRPNGPAIDLDAVRLDADDVTPITEEQLRAEQLRDVPEVLQTGGSIIATETTYALYTTTSDDSGSLRGHVRVTVLDAPADARPICR